VDGTEEKTLIEVDRRMEERGGQKQKRKSKEDLTRTVFVP
jgi:hypothetical protein